MERSLLLAELKEKSFSEFVELFLEATQNFDSFADELSIEIIETIDSLEELLEDRGQQPF